MNNSIDKFFRTYRWVGMAAAIIFMTVLLTNKAYLETNTSFTAFFLLVWLVWGYDLYIKALVKLVCRLANKAYRKIAFKVLWFAGAQRYYGNNDYMNYDALFKWADEVVNDDPISVVMRQNVVLVPLI